jgi:hypothetical protein
MLSLAYPLREPSSVQLKGAQRLQEGVVPLPILLCTVFSVDFEDRHVPFSLEVISGVKEFRP